MLVELSFSHTLEYMSTQIRENPVFHLPGRGRTADKMTVAAWLCAKPIVLAYLI